MVYMNLKPRITFSAKRMLSGDFHQVLHSLACQSVVHCPAKSTPTSASPETFLQMKIHRPLELETLRVGSSNLFQVILMNSKVYKHWSKYLSGFHTYVFISPMLNFGSMNFSSPDIGNSILSQTAASTCWYFSPPIYYILLGIWRTSVGYIHSRSLEVIVNTNLMLHYVIPHIRNTRMAGNPEKNGSKRRWIEF